MIPFLQYVADDILKKYGHDLSRIAVVFPNKRASLFLNDALARGAERPLWSPAYITISELFRSHSHLRVADPIKLVCDLHRTYVEVTGTEETLDHFYGWGQRLIADFDDIDKHIAPAGKVFANLSDIHEMDDISFLNDEQKAIIRQFFSNFSDDHNTLLKERFLRLWSKMGDIYAAFNRRLSAQGLAYEGALYRQVVEDRNITFEHDRYLFVGFNLLQPVEQQLFRRLKNEGRAAFYWDFDHYYMTSEAGHFISQYLSDFPNALDSSDDGIYRNFRKPKRMEIIAAQTEDAQARYVGQWLEQNHRIEAGRRTAIVLCDEGLLQAVVHQLPDAVTHVNITTGYPLQQTHAAVTVRQMMARKEPLNNVIQHITETAKKAADDASPLEAEATFRTYTLLNRLKELVDSGDLIVDHITMQRLVAQLIQQTTIPFHGEPAVGLQVMGVLETRNLDFDHVLLLSANEGNLPRGLNDASFIPYSIRRAFNLTTADHKVAIYAYYFHRLLSRASDVTVVYNNATTDGHTAEMSRFLLQLMVEDRYHDIRRKAIRHAMPQSLSRHKAIEKTPEVMDTLRRRFSEQPLSPTAINSYMRCPLQFYFCYVEGLREPDDQEEGVIDNRLFGNIFHNAAQILYQRLTQQSPCIKAADLERLLKEAVDIERAVDEAFLNEGITPQQAKGSFLINRQVIIHYLRQLVDIDRRLAPFTILKLEEDVLQPVFVSTLHQTITIGGRVDRMDVISADGGEQIRVIDYKTSGNRLKAFKTVDDIFDTDNLHAHSDYYLQAFLYARIVRSRHQLPVAPALLFIQHSSVDDYNPVLKLSGQYVNDVATPDGDRFVDKLMQTVNSIFDASKPFTPTTVTDRCRFCPYRLLCTLVALLMIVCGCTETTVTPTMNAVYYWRTEWRTDSTEAAFLTQYHIHKVYCRYFDVVTNEGEPMPNATIRFLEPVAQTMEIVPTVYMTEDLMHLDSSIYPDLARKIVRRILQMNETNDISNVHEIQIDCDYTRRSRQTYYSFLKEVQSLARDHGLSLSTTIRLHQLSMPPPPADYGVLMLYNTGDPMKFEERNPILDIRDVQPYLRYLADYSLPLAAAYPVFLWQRDIYGTRIEHTATADDILQVKATVESERPELRRQILTYHLDKENINRYTPETYEAIYHH